MKFKKILPLILFSFLLTSCTATPTPSTPVSSIAPPENPQGILLYNGITKDVTKPLYVVDKDGINDLNFSLQVDFQEEVTLESATISRLELGKPYGAIAWTTNLQYWIMAIEYDGKVLNKIKNDPLGKVKGNVKLDFYCGYDKTIDPYLAKGTEYQLNLKYTNSSGEMKEIINKITI